MANYRRRWNGPIRWESNRHLTRLLFGLRKESTSIFSSYGKTETVPSSFRLAQVEPVRGWRWRDFLRSQIRWTIPFFSWICAIKQRHRVFASLTTVVQSRHTDSVFRHAVPARASTAHRASRWRGCTGPCPMRQSHRSQAVSSSFGGRTGCSLQAPAPVSDDFSKTD